MTLVGQILKHSRSRAFFGRNLRHKGYFAGGTTPYETDGAGLLDLVAVTDAHATQDAEGCIFLEAVGVRAVFPRQILDNLGSGAWLATTRSIPCGCAEYARFQ